jgi:pimeloyl-ACP methyl ester carboxylesterase
MNQRAAIDAWHGRSSERQTVSTDGTRLRYRMAGRGPAVVLLHGFSDALETWWDLGIATELARRWLVITPDARGHGRSDKPTLPESYDDAARVADVVAVLDAVRAGRAHVIGYSMGGWTAMLLSTAARDRIGSVAIGGAHPFGLERFLGFG